MSEPETSGVTQLLLQWRGGDHDALEELAPIVYNELRRLARHYMRGERSGHLLQTTALVHEAFVKLVDLEVEWRDRVHFFAIASRLMRRVLVDFARERDAVKRGGQLTILSLEEARVGAGPPPDVLALDAALTKLSKVDERMGRVVELRFFGGLTLEEVAEALEISRATVARHLKVAKAWLGRELQSPERSP